MFNFYHALKKAAITTLALFACNPSPLFANKPKAQAASIDTHVVNEVVGNIASLTKKRANPKDWTFLVYMAANNNLHSFGIRNINQMLQVGSTDSINILVQLDGMGSKQVKRYYIDKGTAVLTNSLDHGQASTSGTPQSLYEFIRWGKENFPSRKMAIVLWNHGSGIKDPSIWGKMMLANRDQFFALNPSTGMLELNRQLGMFEARCVDILQESIEKERGIAFNETYEKYIDNTQLKNVLTKVSTDLLSGNKIDIIAMDACHMGMLEYAYKFKDIARYMIGSAEVEPGPGYNYIKVLSPFLTTTLTPEQFARHIVGAYEHEYQKIDADFTQAAVDLSKVAGIENPIGRIGANLMLMMNGPDGASVTSALKTVRTSILYTTEYFDADYIDAGHFFKSLAQQMENLRTLVPLSEETKNRVIDTRNLANAALLQLRDMLLRGSVGANLSRAIGLAIYFPKRSLHSSYLKTSFDRAAGWSFFLSTYLQAKN